MINKKKMISLRLTEWEYEQLLKATEITKQSKSSFVGMAILEKSARIIEESEKSIDKAKK